MKIVPAIDIYNNRAVRLYKGDYNQIVDYGDPVELAIEFEKSGASLIHLVNLNGAKDGIITNYDLLKRIRESCKLELEYGGGIRSISDIKQLLDLGIDRIILGSKALDLAFLKECYSLFKDKIIVGIDSVAMQVKTHGWLNESNLSSIDFARTIKEIGIKEIIFTDIEKDGTLDGINFKQTKEMIDSTKMLICASGGASSLEDIKKAKEIGCNSIILGKSIYEKKIDLKQAIELFED